MEKNTPFQYITNGKTPVLVEFFAKWCGPCKAMSPILSEVEGRLGNKVKIVKMDVDRNSELVRQLKIRGVPTLMVYKEGEIQWQEFGMKSSAFLTQLLEQHIEAV